MNNPGLKFLKSLLQSNYLWGVVTADDKTVPERGSSRVPRTTERRKKKTC